MGELYCASHLSDLRFSWDQEILIEHEITCYSSEPLGSQVEVGGSRKSWSHCLISPVPFENPLLYFHDKRPDSQDVP